MTNSLLVILTTPRSFSSVVGGMLGQHPDLYGMPETNMFTSDTVQGMIAGYNRAGDQARHGLLRILAQLHDGEQTVESIDRAQQWLHEHSGWSIKQLCDHIRELVAPKIIVEKSPRLVSRVMHLRRVYDMYPDALFLHLTRHPRSMAQSQINITSRNSEWNGRLDSSKIQPQKWWEQWQRNITEFASMLPEGQCMRIKGEDLLSNPDIYLPQIAEWLGVRTDNEAIAAMKRPEDSPYACMGPENALYGNDVNFLKNPKLRTGKVEEPSLIGPLEWSPDERFSPALISLARQFGYS